ncbi:MAG: hypothetical protein HY884_06645 [Deltaproteobacteria bacterium]|nr:hypothetical protein [Deltaproteobacteria bacterium]
MTRVRGIEALVETLSVMVFISVLLVIVIPRFYSSSRDIKETALRIELSNLRGAINFFAMLEKRLPASLAELAEKKAVISKRDVEGRDYKVVFEGRFVEAMTEDAGGRITDTFGNPYVYDPKTGRVASTTKGYEGW